MLYLPQRLAIIGFEPILLFLKKMNCPENKRGEPELSSVYGAIVPDEIGAKVPFDAARPSKSPL